MAVHTEQIKVLYVHHGKSPVGGSPTSLRIQIAALDRDRFAPSIALVTNSRAESAFSGLDVPIRKMGGVWKYGHTTGEWYRLSRPVRFFLQHLRVPISMWNARRFLERLDVDVVHLNSSTLWPVARAAWKLSIPVIWHSREYMVDGYFGIRRRLISAAVRKYAAHIIAISRADLNRICNAPMDRADVIYNFVDFNKFDRSISGEALRRNWGVGQHEQVVTFVGGISPAKGTMVYLDAARQMVQQRSNVRFLLVGPRSRLYGGALWKRMLCRALRWRDASYFDQILNALADPLMKSHLLHLGPRGDIPEIFAASDIVVFPSTEPHFGRPLIEAAAMGKPAVASDLPGPQEIIIDGETGLLTPAGDAAALAEALTRILNGPEMAAGMGEKAYERAKQLFNADISIRRIEAIYERVLA